MGRKYELKRRAERRDTTRRRIVDATIALHGEVGVSETTVTAIAERAGVSRLTVYRHFPDERSLLSACTGTFFATHPLPDPAGWSTIVDPVARLRTALGELYPYYRRNALLLGRGEQDAPTNQNLAEVMAPFYAAVDEMRDVLARGWIDRPSGGGVVTAVIGHAVAFSTWQSLSSQGLDDADAVEFMVALATNARTVARDRARVSAARPASARRAS